ncbi:sugar ABC transporter ATP-binding protein [Nakamurella flavida]|uniref:Sugar ABC transporter ATP-binding protein n=1 Tax=Nakamurella flavida TaxID=363630 RepID=A0A939C5F7_9ACTN|nr:sugar ABC transporter ATP-binding protein [Nakamurella flavida]MBM9476147.1 sugar ABC transporter ATP-binding protein [Nakamurella flavida]MDP9777108.1 ABC-type sugar transport system ATPase subunit [Nakamurella flavida]
MASPDPSDGAPPVDRPAPFIQARNVSRSFGAVAALTDVSVDFRRGEIHGLVGANGAGKSTLLNIIGGVITPSTGEILVDGEARSITRPGDADALGFAFMHQELALIPDFSTIDNMTLGLKDVGRAGFVDRRVATRRAREVADLLGITFSLRRPVRQLSPAERGLVAIGRALVRNARFIAMDEPTAVLSDVECRRLFRIVRDLAATGVTIAYVSHRLGEIEELSDRITVFKDGRVTGRLERGGYTRDDLVRGITGSNAGLGPRAEISRVERDAPVLFRAAHLSDGMRVRDVSFDVRAGEIVGLAGVVGAGRTETLGLVFGESRPISGSMMLDGGPYRAANVREAIRQGVALVPEERRSQALIMTDSVRANIAMGAWGSTVTRRLLPFVSDRRAQRTAQDMVGALQIKARDTQVAVGTLSGGNQQKVVFGRWLARGARLMLLDEPTRGVDIGARQQIWQTIEDFAAAGNAVVVVSSELEELSICHRVVVMVEGRTVGELAGPGVTEEQMLAQIYTTRTKEETA